ncbi:MAG: thioredoxin family protein [Gemmatimonadota bacterium]|nr:thioredoxin family protein [Gemmatimonadota bacterium]
MPSLKDRFDAGLDFDAMLGSATKNVELYRSFRSRAVAPAEFASRIATTGRRWHLLVISEDWCGDSVNIVPWVDALSTSSSLTEMRIIGREDNLDLMDRHLTDGRSRAIPIVLLLDDAFVERGWWGPRPAELQAWFWSPDAQVLGKDARYKELRLRYSRDRGRSIMEELTLLIERAAVQDASRDSATDIAAP